MKKAEESKTATTFFILRLNQKFTKMLLEAKKSENQKIEKRKAKKV